jgi:hypothetical protein
MPKDRARTERRKLPSLDEAKAVFKAEYEAWNSGTG